MSDRPNFLFIITDQHRADHLGCYGNPVVRTPHIDGLASSGTRFERFYTATPICMPNRATLMTGRMPSLHGVRHNGIPLSLEATTFTDVMAAAGYHTALIGKCHLQSIKDDLPVIGMPQPDPRRVRPPELLREARKSIGGALRPGAAVHLGAGAGVRAGVSLLWFPARGVVHQARGSSGGTLRTVAPGAPSGPRLSARGGRTSFPATTTRRPRHGAPACPKNFIPPATWPSAPWRSWRSTRAPGRTGRSSSSARFPTRITRSPHPDVIGTSTIRRRSLCRARSTKASIRCSRIWPGSTRSATGARPTATASVASPSPSGKRAKPSRLTYGMITMIDDAIGRIRSAARGPGAGGRHGHRLHQRSRRLHGRPPAPAQGRAALSRPRAGALHLG